MAIHVGQWDCKHCGHIGNIGYSTKCVNCGGYRPKDVKFYLPDDAKIVSDDKLIKQAYSGADWVCSFCQSHNKAADSKCYACGNERDVTDGDFSLKTHEYDLNNVPKTGKKVNTDNKSLEKPKKSRFPKIIIGLLLVIFVAIILSFINSDIKVEVVGHEWKTAIKPQYYRMVQEEAWQMPSQAQNVEAFRAVHHYDNVFDGYEMRTRRVQKQTGTRKVKVGTRDLGNGMFEDIYKEQPVYEEFIEEYKAERYKKVPVYRKKYRYNIHRWVTEAPLVRTGNDHTPLLYEINTHEKYRVINKTAEYTLLIKDHKNKIRKEIVPEFFWKNVQKGDKIKAEKSLVYNTYKHIIIP